MQPWEMKNSHRSSIQEKNEFSVHVLKWKRRGIREKQQIHFVSWPALAAGDEFCPSRHNQHPVYVCAGFSSSPHPCLGIAGNAAPHPCLLLPQGLLEESGQGPYWGTIVGILGVHQGCERVVVF